MCVIWQINQLWRSSFFCKCSKFHVDFENARKSLEKAFCFRDNCFWIGCVKLSLFRREYWSSAVNVFTNTYKALRLTKADFFHSLTFKMITKYGNGTVFQIATVFERVYHVASQRVLWNGTFWTNIQPRLSECVISEINQLWRSSFFWKCSKFHVDLENARKIREKVFRFWDNCFRTGSVKLSLLRREYWSSAFNVLTNTYKALLLTKTDFFRLNFIQNDH